MTIFVLGGNGYLGSKIVNTLNNNKVYCTARCSESLNLLTVTQNVTVIDAGIEKVKDCIKNNNIDVLINTVCSYEREDVAPSTIIASNLIYPAEVISYAIERNVSKILTIDTALPSTLNMYAKAKSMLSEIGKYYCTKYSELCFLNIKLENFYGEDEPKNRFLHKIISDMKQDNPIKLTVGTQHRDFIYIGDVVKAIELLIYQQIIGYHDVPLGTGEGPTIREVVMYLKQMLNSKSALQFGAIQSRVNEPDCVADMTYLKSLGFNIQYPYKVGLRRII